MAQVEQKSAITVSENLAALDEAEAECAGNFNTYQFTFDHVYDEHETQSTVYSTTAKSAIVSTLEGYNASIIAYGQTGTGKTYTMEGEPWTAGSRMNEETRGIIPRATQEIFEHIESAASDRKRFLVRASYLQIYNEVISDLLKVSPLPRCVPLVAVVLVDQDVCSLSAQTCIFARINARVFLWKA